MARDVRGLLEAGIAALESDSSADRHLEASILLAHVLGRPRSWLFAHPEDFVDPDAGSRYRLMLEQRAQGEPMAYITGKREFWSMTLEVSRDTLIPRPETESLVELALATALPGDACAADLGTGSGAIAAALASERPDWRISATDISEAALAVASANFRRLGLTQIQCLHGDWLGPLSGLDFQLIVSNPPYVSDGDPHLAQGDLRREPKGALVSGIDGLDAIREIIREARMHLRPPGWLMLEHGLEQGDKVRELLSSSGYSSIATHRDLSNKERVTVAQYLKD